MEFLGIISEMTESSGVILMLNYQGKYNVKPSQEDLVVNKRRKGWNKTYGIFIIFRINMTTKCRDLMDRILDFYHDGT